MGCASCGVVTNGKVQGCGSGGGCSTGGCNRMNVFDWFADMPITFSEKVFNVVEVSFKNGARKGYFRNINYLELMKGDLVVVEAAQGFDIGEVSLKGELVKLQLKKNNIKDRADTIKNIVRIASTKDRLKLAEVRSQEHKIMVTARVIARELKLDMKLGDVEIQGDGTKATFYYTAEDRVDFRELVKRYAKDFKVKIEMRQIGSRQEAGRIGGMGSCGRELCCSTWLSDFKTVNTNTARYQNIAINTDKLSGQCGRLKCCLNYELDSYLDALNSFPKEIQRLDTKEASAKLIKTEILTQMMWFKFEGSDRIYKLSAQDAHKIYKDNLKGIRPESLGDFTAPEVKKEEAKYEELVGHISMEALESKNKKKKKKKKAPGRNEEPATATSNTKAPNQKAPQQKAQGPKPGQNQANKGGAPIPKNSGHAPKAAPQQNQPKRNDGQNNPRNRNTHNKRPNQGGGDAKS